MSDLDIRKEEGDSRGRYVVTVDGHEAELTYSKMGAKAVIADHTGVPEALKGKGVGQALVNALIADARATGFRIVPLCPFVKAQAARHPEWSDVIMG